jgi:aspartate kinase
MRVFKFGGASVKDAESIKNVSEIVGRYTNEKLVVVVSAMGKTTNHLENLFHCWWNKENWQKEFSIISSYHHQILKDLEADSNLVNEVDEMLMNLELQLEKNIQRSNYDMSYDQVICYGELLSSKILNYQLSKSKINCRWLDIRNFIITDELYREARVDWKLTEDLITRKIPKLLESSIIVTQGFIGSTPNNNTTTLGREGSDFTASILAYCLNAEEVVIWKDVPGIMNADPKRFDNTVLFNQLSYNQAIEMTYYGARVLHPKTIKPLQNKHISLQVRSFINPEFAGTKVEELEHENKENQVLIVKDLQLLITLSTKDFSFIAEDNIKTIFDEVVRLGIKVNVMYNTAISYGICVDNMETKVLPFIETLSKEYAIETVADLKLLTVMYRNKELIGNLLQGYEVINEARRGSTIQFIIKTTDENLTEWK